MKMRELRVGWARLINRRGHREEVDVNVEFRTPNVGCRRGIKVRDAINEAGTSYLKEFLVHRLAPMPRMKASKPVLGVGGHLSLESKLLETQE